MPGHSSFTGKAHLPLSYYGYEWGGVDPKNGNNVWYVNNPADAKAGDFLYNDRGATYSFNKANYKIVGDAMPDVYGGLNTGLEYKGVTLGLNFIYKIGGKLYDGAFKDVSDDGYYWERIRTESLYAKYVDARKHIRQLCRSLEAPTLPIRCSTAPVR